MFWQGESWAEFVADKATERALACDRCGHDAWTSDRNESGIWVPVCDLCGHELAVSKLAKLEAEEEE
jgi:ribosomal protein L37AE/L43A